MVQNAKQLAEEKAAGDSEQLAKIERAYNFFIDASRERFEAAVEQNPGSADAAFQLANFCQSVDDTARAEVRCRSRAHPCTARSSPHRRENIIARPEIGATGGQPCRLRHRLRHRLCQVQRACRSGTRRRSSSTRATWTR